MNGTEDETVSLFDASLAIPWWEAVLVMTFLPLIILATIIGNVLVIISVFTYAPLKITPNYFIVSLSMADLTVAIFVLPFNVIYILTDTWLFPSSVCKMWLTADVLCCTASILNLCAIALDRYHALHDPIAHAQRRTVKYVLTKIFFVWFISCLICLPPLIGWNDWPDVWTAATPCTLTSEKGYVLYSSMGSFYIPLAVIIFVYWKIYENTRQRLRKRAKASNLTLLKRATKDGSKEKAVAETNVDGLTSDKTRVKALRVSLEVDKGGPSVKSKAEDQAQSLNENGDIKHPHLRHICSQGEPGADSRPNDIVAEDGVGDTDTEAKKQQQPDQVYQFINEKAKISLAKERKAARTMTIIVSTFVICWLPFFLMYLIMPFCSSCNAGPQLVQFITWLGYINSTLNPLIYTIFNVDFRNAFSRILSGKICCPT